MHLDGCVGKLTYLSCSKDDEEKTNDWKFANSCSLLICGSFGVYSTSGQNHLHMFIHVDQYSLAYIHAMGHITLYFLCSGVD